MRTIEPRSTAEAMIWFGASKCGSSRRYAFTLAFSSRQMSLPCVRMRSTNSQANLLIFSSPFGSQNRFLPPLRDRNVGVHAAAVDAHHRLRQEARRQPHVRGHLAADQLVELDLVGRRHHFGVAVVDLELRRRHFRVILLVLEAHRALHFGAAVDEERAADRPAASDSSRRCSRTRTCRSRDSAARRPTPLNRKPSISLAAFSV